MARLLESTLSRTRRIQRHLDGPTPTPLPAYAPTLGGIVPVPHASGHGDLVLLGGGVGAGSQRKIDVGA
eukprot:1095325-Rhodomonas_salina.4